MGQAAAVRRRSRRKRVRLGSIGVTTVSEPTTKQDLYRFLAKEVDAATHARIAAELRDQDSPTRRMYERLRHKLSNPFRIDWPALLTDLSARAPSASNDEQNAVDAFVGSGDEGWQDQIVDE